MITSFEHNYNIGDTVYLIFLSKGKYRVRKKTGYKIRTIRFNLSTPLPFFAQPEDKKEKSVYYWFEGYWGACITTPVIRLNDIFDIIPVDDWETSLRKVGK